MHNSWHSFVGPQFACHRNRLLLSPQLFNFSPTTPGRARTQSAPPVSANDGRKITVETRNGGSQPPGGCVHTRPPTGRPSSRVNSVASAPAAAPNRHPSAILVSTLFWKILVTRASEIFRGQARSSRRVSGCHQRRATGPRRRSRLRLTG